MLLGAAILSCACAMHRATIQPSVGDGSAPSWVELQPGMELTVEGAYYREGSPKISFADYLGAETASYEVAAGGTLRLTSISSFVTEQPGKMQPRDQPAVQTLVRPRNLSFRYHRLFFQVVMSRMGTTRPAVLLGARSSSALDGITRQFLSGKDSLCDATPSDQCTSFPAMCTASLKIGITVNGAARKVVWGTTLAAVVSHPSKIVVKRLINGRMWLVQIDLSDPDAIRTPLLHGDEIRSE